MTFPQGPLVVAPVRLQHAEDCDMMFDVLVESEVHMQPMRLSWFDPNHLRYRNANDTLLMAEYEALNELYSSGRVFKNLSKGDAYVPRNRYLDILTYDKTRVRL